MVLRLLTNRREDLVVMRTQSLLVIALLAVPVVTTRAINVLPGRRTVAARSSLSLPAHMLLP